MIKRSFFWSPWRTSNPPVSPAAPVHLLICDSAELRRLMVLIHRGLCCPLMHWPASWPDDPPPITCWDWRVCRLGGAAGLCCGRWAPHWAECVSMINETVKYPLTCECLARWHCGVLSVVQLWAAVGGSAPDPSCWTLPPPGWTPAALWINEGPAAAERWVSGTSARGGPVIVWQASAAVPPQGPEDRLQSAGGVCGWRGCRRSEVQLDQVSTFSHTGGSCGPTAAYQPCRCDDVWCWDEFCCWNGPGCLRWRWVTGPAAQQTPMDL